MMDGGGGSRRGWQRPRALTGPNFTRVGGRGGRLIRAESGEHAQTAAETEEGGGGKKKFE